MADTYAQARLIALQLFETLNVDGADYTGALDQAITFALQMPPYRHVQANQLRQDLESSVNVTINNARLLLDDGTEHTPWLLEKKHQLHWPFWERYRIFLLRERRLPPRIVERLDSISDEILGLLE